MGNVEYILSETLIYINMILWWYKEVIIWNIWMMGDTPCVMKGAEARYNGRFTRVRRVFGFVSTKLVILFLIIWFYRDDITNINGNFIIFFFTRHTPNFNCLPFSLLPRLKTHHFSIFVTFWFWGFADRFFLPLLCAYYENDEFFFF